MRKLPPSFEVSFEHRQAKEQNNKNFQHKTKAPKSKLQEIMDATRVQKEIQNREMERNRMYATSTPTQSLAAIASQLNVTSKPKRTVREKTIEEFNRELEEEQRQDRRTARPGRSIALLGGGSIIGHAATHHPAKVMNLKALNVSQLFQPVSLAQLHKHILSQDYFRILFADILGQTMPAEKRLASVPLSFDSAEEYRRCFEPLLIEEFKAQLQSSGREDWTIVNQLLDSLRNNSHAQLSFNLAHDDEDETSSIAIQTVKMLNSCRKGPLTAAEITVEESTELRGSGQHNRSEIRFNSDDLVLLCNVRPTKARVHKVFRAILEGKSGVEKTPQNRRRTSRMINDEDSDQEDSNSDDDNDEISTASRANPSFYYIMGVIDSVKIQRLSDRDTNRALPNMPRTVRILNMKLMPMDLVAFNRYSMSGSRWYMAKLTSLTPVQREFFALHTIVSLEKMLEEVGVNLPLEEEASSSSSTFSSSRLALKRLASSLYDIKQLVLQPGDFSKKLKNSSLPVSISSVSPTLEQCLKREYNNSQFKAIISCLECPPGKISLIQGPPGTGKTRTIIGILSGLLSTCQRNVSLYRIIAYLLFTNPTHTWENRLKTALKY
jgi:hypothetical protein